jgi:hypothetical protein
LKELRKKRGVEKRKQETGGTELRLTQDIRIIMARGSNP